jgi:hypothetical protein
MMYAVNKRSNQPITVWELKVISLSCYKIGKPESIYISGFVLVLRITKLLCAILIELNTASAFIYICRII